MFRLSARWEILVEPAGRLCFAVTLRATWAGDMWLVMPYRCVATRPANGRVHLVRTVWCVSTTEVRDGVVDDAVGLLVQMTELAVRSRNPVCERSQAGSTWWRQTTTGTGTHSTPRVEKTPRLPLSFMRSAYEPGLPSTFTLSKRARCATTG